MSGFTVALVLSGHMPLEAAQVLRAPVSGAGQTVTPAYEGWYDNPDRTVSVSCGYFNLNDEEVLEIPTGSANCILPGDPNQGQPTRFQSR